MERSKQELAKEKEDYLEMNSECDWHVVVKG